jgi:5-methylcytosine-specific restriction endonuclease McrA
MVKRVVRASQHRVRNDRRGGVRCVHEGDGRVKRRIHQRLTSWNRRQMVQRLLGRDGRCCAICNKALSFADITLDHVIPRSRGGSNDEQNLRILCAPCNNGRHNDNHFTSIDLTLPDLPHVIEISPDARERPLVSAGCAPPPQRGGSTAENPRLETTCEAALSHESPDPTSRVQRSVTSQTTDEVSRSIPPSRTVRSKRKRIAGDVARSTCSSRILRSSSLRPSVSLGAGLSAGAFRTSFYSRDESTGRLREQPESTHPRSRKENVRHTNHMDFANPAQTRRQRDSCGTRGFARDLAEVDSPVDNSWQFPQVLDMLAPQLRGPNRKEADPNTKSSASDVATEDASLSAFKSQVVSIDLVSDEND